MCGIVGVVSRTTTGLFKQGEDTFMQLLYANALRGDDSTGLVCVEKDTSFHIAKQASEAAFYLPQFIGSAIHKKMFSSGKAYIGHNRKKTVGKVADETAHPFTVDGEFAMVHNGTLYNHRTLANTEVDSEALTQVLAKAFEKEDYIPDLEETLGRVDGAYAVAMYDQRHNVVRLLRNKERPLSMVETPNAWFFASEGMMLFWILSRNGYAMKDVTITPVPEDTVVTFDLDKNTVALEAIKPKKSIPQSTKVTTVAGGKVTTIVKPKKNLPEGMTKNSFKRFRRRLLGKRVEWWAEDYVETNFPKTEAQGETLFDLMGTCDEIFEDHMVSATVDTAILKCPSQDLYDRLWSSRISEISYDTMTRLITISMEDTVPVAVPPKPTVIDDKYIQERLDEEEKALVTLH